MPLTIKTTRLKYKDSNGDYVGVDAVAEQTTSEAISDITSAKTTAITAIENKQSAAETAVQNKGTTTLASIPQDYTTLSGDVTDLKEDLTNLGLIASYVGNQWDSLEHKSIDTSGVESASNYYRATDYISVKSGDIVYYNLYSTTTVNAISFYSSESTSGYTDGIYGARETETPTVLVIESDGFIRVCCNMSNIENPFLIVISGFILKFDNYDNRINTMENGINDIDRKILSIGMTESFIGSEWDSLGKKSVNTSGVSSNSANYRLTDFIKVSKGDLILYSLYSTSSVNAISYYSSATESSYDGSKISVTGARGTAIPTQLVVPADGYVRGCTNYNNLPNSVFIVITGLLKELKDSISIFQSYMNAVGKYGIWSFKEQEDSIVNQILSDKDSNTITFGIITDTHNTNSNNRRSAKQAIAINAICEKVGADFIAHLGDVIEGSLSTKALNQQYLAEYWEAQNQTFLPLLYTIAHHEQYGPLGASYWGNDANALSASECLGMKSATSRVLNVTYSNDKASWWFDLCGVRFIGLDSASRKGENGSPTSFSVDVLDFLASALSNCTLPVIVLSHAPASASVSARATYTQNGDDATIDSYGEGRQSVVAQLNAHTPGVLAYIHGHTHWDNIAKPTDCDFYYISVINAYAGKSDTATDGTDRGVIGTPTSYDRVVGEYSEYGFDIINYHVDTGTFNLFRVGAGTNRTFTVT